MDQIRKARKLRTKEEYVEKLLSMRSNVYMGGKLIRRNDPSLQPGINAISLTFDLASDPQYKGLMTATSHITGEEINRFTHINQTSEDLLRKQEMIRSYCHKTGRCIQRCMGCDAINALSVAAYEIDQECGTGYYKRFLRYLNFFQDNDLVAACAQTDAKGDRSLRPYQQADPDQYVHMVEKKSGGIIVRGAKAHITIAPYADDLVIVPTRAMRSEKEADYAVAFAVPADAEGIKLITTSHVQHPRKKLSAPIEKFASAHSMVVFDDVFVPWNKVFMCGEWQFARRLALLFATYHRHSYTGCKPAMTDILTGATALVSEYNGIERASHVRDKLAEMAVIAELTYAAGVASALYGKKSLSGTFEPNVVYANAGRYNAGVNIYREFEILADVAGGLVATLPYEEDYLNPATKPYVEKYITRKQDVPADYQYRCFRLIQDLICSRPGAASQISGIHGGGSPVMERIVIMASYNIEEKKSIAKYLAGISES